MNFINYFHLSGNLKSSTKPETITFANGGSAYKFTIGVTNTDPVNGKENIFYIEITCNDAKMQMFHGLLKPGEFVSITGDLVSTPFVSQAGKQTAFFKARPYVIAFPKLGKQVELRFVSSSTQNMQNQQNNFQAPEAPKQENPFSNPLVPNEEFAF